MAYRITKGRAPPFPKRSHNSPYPVARFDQHAILYKLFPEHQSEYDTSCPADTMVGLDDVDSEEGHSTPAMPGHTPETGHDDGRHSLSLDERHADWEKHDGSLASPSDLLEAQTETTGNGSKIMDDASITPLNDAERHSLPLDEGHNNRQNYDAYSESLGDLPIAQMETVHHGSRNIIDASIVRPSHSPTPPRDSGKPKGAIEENDTSNIEADEEDIGSDRRESMELEYPFRSASVLTVSWVRSSPPILPGGRGFRDSSALRENWDDDDDDDEIVIPDSHDKRQREQFLGQLERPIDHQLQGKLPQPTLLEMLARLRR